MDDIRRSKLQLIFLLTNLADCSLKAILKEPLPSDIHWLCWFLGSGQRRATREQTNRLANDTFWSKVRQDVTNERTKKDFAKGIWPTTCKVFSTHCWKRRFQCRVELWWSLVMVDFGIQRLDGKLSWVNPSIQVVVADFCLFLCNSSFLFDMLRICDVF